MKRYFLTLDLEEWYHLEYLKEHIGKIASDQKFVPQVIPFLEEMARSGILMTVFVLGCIARDNASLIRRIAQMGHEIGCHGYQHILVYSLTVDQFRAETKLAKDIIDEIIGSPIQGYRAPCFSMENDKLHVLWELGFTYDASLIRCRQHRLYNVLDMSSFERAGSLIYRSGERYEIETPTLDVMGRSIPISGGGYFRLFPLWLMNWFMMKHWETEDNFVFYVHPFELCGEPLINARRMGLRNYIRFQIGRRHLQKKLIKHIEWLKKQSVQFMRLSEYVGNQFLPDHERGECR